MVYDHLMECIFREIDRIKFMTFSHASPPRISCPENGIMETVIPWKGKRSRFTIRLETRSITMLQNTDIYNFTDIMKLPWKQAWNLLDRAVKRGGVNFIPAKMHKNQPALQGERKNGHPSGNLPEKYRE